ncbi:unnamed protein product [Adineta steineri]|uniref:Uncharacterized protein n=1 Tax=Adineta steineri TaxID=433720 RepID=A0A818Q036_9BILA|nr:unnamed protein product [Adineta steineri]CAF1377256.1 unnamed protein product [Adineta steineri]CAF3628724.1 unnamed protein product [Adineta steineri]CAF4112074.1 unnamed protein product [Adineta steineri]
MHYLSYICQIQASTFNNDESEMVDLDTIREFIPSSQDQFYHQQYRRASLRYHPHILYKKASLKPILGNNGKIVLSERDRY